MRPEQIREAFFTFHEYTRPGTPLREFTADSEYYDRWRGASVALSNAALAYADALERFLLVPKDAPSIEVLPTAIDGTMAYGDRGKPSGRYVLVEGAG